MGTEWDSFWSSTAHMNFSICNGRRMSPLNDVLPLEAGLTLIVDHSGRIAKRPTIKDVVANRHVPAYEVVDRIPNSPTGWSWEGEKTIFSEMVVPIHVDI